MIGRWVALATGLAMLVQPTSGSAQTPASAVKPQAADSCVYNTQLGATHPLGDRAVIFRANASDFYRMDFAQRCAMLTYPNPKLILSFFGGSGLICRAMDVDVKVGDQGPAAFAEPCIPSAWHKMTAAEVAATPKKALP